MWRKKPSLRYGCVWEDADVLCLALAPVATDRRLLSISSAGDNTLALLTLNPSEVAAIDVDRSQIAALDLRARAFEALSHDELLGFLGVSLGGDRLATYRRVRPALSEQSRVFWDRVPRAVDRGIIHSGLFERYMKRFRSLFPRRIRMALGRLAEAVTVSDRARIYDTEHDGLLWRAVTSIAFAPRTISALDYRRTYFDNASIGSVMRERLRHAFVTKPWTKSPYLTYFVTGNYSREALPLYLRAEHHEAIRSRLARLTMHHMDVTDAASLGFFSGFNLSNVFEHVGPIRFASTYQSVIAAAAPNSRLAYWYAFTARTGESVASRVTPLAVASALHQQDTVGAYQSFHLDEVHEEGMIGGLTAE